MRVALTILWALIIGISASLLAGLIFPPLYARSLGVSLYELSEDYGFGLLGLLIQSAVFFIGTIASFCLIFWFEKLKSFFQKKKR